MNKEILSNEEETNEKLMWQPARQAADTEATTMSTQSNNCCAVTGVTLLDTDIELDMKETYQMRYTVSPLNATNKAVSWDSDPEGIVSVSNTGLVTPIQPGKTEVIVTTQDGDKSAKCTVNVKIGVTGVVLTETALTLDKKTSHQLNYKVYPSKATNQEVTWSSYPAGIVNVSDSGLICPIKAGQTKITVKTKDGAKTDTCCVIVYDVDYQDPSNSRYVYAIGKIQVKKEASGDSDTIIELTKDTCLKVLGQKTGDDKQQWHKVELLNGATGYVKVAEATTAPKTPGNLFMNSKGRVLYYHVAEKADGGYLDAYKMMVNASYIFNNLISQESTFNDLGSEKTVKKWTANAIYGLLGNVAVESRMNPELWQNGEGSTTGGFGLTQWTPPYGEEKYIVWARKNYENADDTLWNMDWQLECIRHEVYKDMNFNNRYQWTNKSLTEKMTFEDFTQSDKSAEDLAEIFVRAYERPGALSKSEEEEQECVDRRRCLANNWKTFFESNMQTFYVHDV